MPVTAHAGTCAGPRTGAARPGRWSGTRRLRRALPALWFALLLPSAAGSVEATVPMPPDPVPASFVAGHFSLKDPAGRSVDTDALGERPYGLFFGFTQCPDICPTTLAQLSLALARIPDPALRVYFVTVDPERDTPAVLGQYMASFDPRIVALTGERPAVDEALASFGIVAKRHDQGEGRYAYGHTASLILVDENGVVIDRASADADVDTLTARLARLARPQPATSAQTGP